MRFHQYIQYRALTAKAEYEHETKPFERLLDEATEQGKVSRTRNVCAAISLELFNELEALTDRLDVSKRKFIEMAIYEALEVARAIEAEVNPYESHEEQAESVEGAAS